MGLEGFDFADTNEIFEIASERSAGGRRDFAALIEKARADGVKGHDPLRTFGTTGLQTPLGLEGGELTETVPQHADMTFKTDSDKLVFIRADWDEVARRNAALGPDESKEKVWVLNGRINAVWNNMFDHLRRRNSAVRWPSNFLEVNPEDATARGIVNGGLPSVESDNVLDQLGRPHTGASRRSRT